MSNHSPEVELWKAVVTQAVIDASWHQTGKHESVGDSIVNRDQARAWLLGNSTDFRNVCTMAGFDPDAVRESAQRKDAEDWPAVRLMRAA